MGLREALFGRQEYTFNLNMFITYNRQLMTLIIASNRDQHLFEKKRKERCIIKLQNNATDL